MTTVVPSLLVHSEEEFHEKNNHELMHVLAPVWHFDVLDRSMFDQASWADPKIVAAADIVPIIELHLMIQNPTETFARWKHRLPRVKTAIIHAEIEQPLPEVIEEIKKFKTEVGVAVNPNTDIEVIEPIADAIDQVLIMGVEPGKSGQAFLGEKILFKIEEAKQRFPHLTLSVDGGIKPENASAIKKAGADQIVAASALWGAEDPKLAFQALKSA